MHTEYDDILSRIKSEPLWFDEYAVPRYCAFEPRRPVDICSGEIALVEIACQCCGGIFQVALSRANFQSATIAEAIRTRTLRYGDPPNACCTPGNSTTSVPRRVVEYWHRYDPRYVEGNLVKDHRYSAWTHEPSLEIDIRPDWALKQDQNRQG